MEKIACKKTRLPSFANAWQGFSANFHKIVDVFLFVFNSEKVVSAQASGIPHSIYVLYSGKTLLVVRSRIVLLP
jgi:hypothetical protein